jgi:hypothetical protein
MTTACSPKPTERAAVSIYVLPTASGAPAALLRDKRSDKVTTGLGENLQVISSIQTVSRNPTAQHILVKNKQRS